MSRSPALPTHELSEDVVADVNPGRAWRHGRLRRVTVWAALAAGPLALFASCASTRLPARAPAHTVAAAAGPALAQDPSGFAQLVVSLWLRTGGSADDAHLGALRALAPNIDLRTAPNSPASGTTSVAQCASVRSTLVREGYWSVTVGCETDGQLSALRYFTVPIQMTPADGGIGSFAVVAQPAAIAAPTAAEAPQALYPDSAAAGTPLASAVGAFATAYLTGQGDLSALLSPGTHIPPQPQRCTRADKPGAGGTPGDPARGHPPGSPEQVTAFPGQRMNGPASSVGTNPAVTPCTSCLCRILWTRTSVRRDPSPAR